jgi:hypothetical protein
VRMADALLLFVLVVCTGCLYWLFVLVVRARCSWMVRVCHQR